MGWLEVLADVARSNEAAMLAELDDEDAATREGVPLELWRSLR